jgi:hypothetical protein
LEELSKHLLSGQSSLYLDSIEARSNAPHPRQMDREAFFVMAKVDDIGDAQNVVAQSLSIIPLLQRSNSN